MSFKIRKKPIKPVRKKNVKYTKYMYDGENLTSLNEWLKEHNATLDDVSIEKEYGYYDEIDIVATICVDEIEKEYQQRLKYYEIRKQKYNDWRNTYKESIEKELKRRKENELKAKQKELEKEKQRKKKEKIKLEKRLAKLNKELKE